MHWKRVALGVTVAVVIYFLVNKPEHAGSFVNTAFGTVEHVFDASGVFLSTIT